jgi:hypothetical protein
MLFRHTGDRPIVVSPMRTASPQGRGALIDFIKAGT